MSNMSEDPVAYWNDSAGPKWANIQEPIDRMMTPITTELMAQLAPQLGESAIDVGCGTGELSELLADKVGSTGQVLAVDVSEPLLKKAQERLSKVSHVKFLLADAGTTPFKPESDILTSRFGVMFFPDPVTAFSNLRSALNPKKGRMVFVCWQAPNNNRWLQLTSEVFPEMPPQLPDGDVPGPFSLASPDKQRAILSAAGFKNINIHPFETHLSWGETVETALNLVTQVGPFSRILSDAQPEEHPYLLERITDFLTKEYANGPRFYQTAAWITHGHV